MCVPFRAPPNRGLRRRVTLNDDKGARKMTVYELVATVLAFVREHGPIGAVACVTGALAAALAVFYLLAKSEAQFVRRKSFFVGGEFFHFYAEVLPAARSGVVALIYAAYAGLWLWGWPANRQYPLLHEPYDSVFFGMVVTLVVGGLAARGAWGLAKAAWFAWRWLRLEACGVLWQITDDGEPHRVMWLRRNGECVLDATVRELRLAQELAFSGQRRKQLITDAVIAAVAIIVWTHGQAFVKTLYPLFPSWVVIFLRNWGALQISILLVFFFVVIPRTVGVIAALLDELLYRSGAQYVTGAKVLDLRAVRPSRAEVETQKVHGDADFVTAAEAVRDMLGHRKS